MIGITSANLLVEVIGRKSGFQSAAGDHLFSVLTMEGFDCSPLTCTDSAIKMLLAPSMPMSHASISAATAKIHSQQSLA